MQYYRFLSIIINKDTWKLNLLEKLYLELFLLH